MWHGPKIAVKQKEMQSLQFIRLSFDGQDANITGSVKEANDIEEYFV